jgi:DNA repair exonuclease SbcCD ATPase subunit
VRLDAAVIHIFGSYVEPFFFDFRNPLGLIAVLGTNHDEPRMTSNGSGKSTLPEAIEWGLFGTTERGRADSIINEDAKAAHVDVYFRNAKGVECRVERTRGMPKMKDGVRIFIGGENKTTPDSDETQLRIDEELGLNHGEFRSLAFLSQNDNAAKFAEGTDKEREQIFTDVLKLGYLEDYEVKTSNLRGKVTTKLVEIDAQISLLSVPHAQIDYEQQIAQWDLLRDSKLNALLTKYNEKTALCAQLQDEANKAQSVMAHAAQGAEPMKMLQEQLQEQRRAEAAIKAQYHAKVGVQSTVKQKLAQAEHALTHTPTDTNCPTCGQVVKGAAPAAHFYAAKHAEVDEAKATLEHLDGILAALAEEGVKKQKLIWELENAAQKGAQDVEHAKMANVAYTEKLKAYGQACKDLNDIIEQTKQVTHEVNPYVQQREQAKLQEEQRKAKLAELHVIRGQLEHDRKLLAFWEEGFGSKGLRRYLFDAALDELNTEINRWLWLLTGGTHWVRVETQTLTAAKKLSEKFNIRVFKYLPDGSIRERGYESFSGGERFRLALALFLGIGRLKGLRSGKLSNVLWLDEVFQRSLDSGGKEAIAEVLAVLAKEYETIFVIEHDLIFQGLFAHVLHVEKKNGRSRVVA